MLTLGARAEDHRAGARLADGPRGGDRLRARARHPRQGRHRGAAVLDRRQHLGPLVRGRRRSRTWPSRRATTCSSWSPSPQDAPDEHQDLAVGFEHGVPGRARRRAARPGRAARARRRPARSHGVGIVDHIEDRIVGLKVRDLYEVPAAAIILHRAHRAREAGGHDPPEQVQARLDRQWAFLVYAGLWHEPLRGDLDAYMESVNEQVTGEITMRLYKGRARRWRAARRTPSTTRSWPASASPAACSRSRRAPASSSCGASSRGWLTRYGTGKKEDS